MYFLKKCPVCLHPVVSLIRPAPSIQWIRKDGVLSESRTSNDNYNRVLRFLKISESDGGEYQCTATNVQGMITHTYSITVEGTVCFTLPDHFLCRFRCGVWTWRDIWVDDLKKKIKIRLCWWKQQPQSGFTLLALHDWCIIAYCLIKVYWLFLLKSCIIVANYCFSWLVVCFVVIKLPHIGLKNQRASCTPQERRSNWNVRLTAFQAPRSPGASTAIFLLVTDSVRKHSMS